MYSPTIPWPLLILRAFRGLAFSLAFANCPPPPPPLPLPFPPLPPPLPHCPLPPEFLNFREPKNRFQETNSARLYNFVKTTNTFKLSRFHFSACLLWKILTAHDQYAYFRVLYALGWYAREQRPMLPQKKRVIWCFSEGVTVSRDICVFSKFFFVKRILVQS